MKKLLLLLVVLGFAVQSWGQDGKNQEISNDTIPEISKLTAKIEYLTKLVEKNNDDVTQDVGKIITHKSLKSITISILIDKKEQTVGEVDIDYISIMIKNGCILEIQAVSDKRVFSNKWSPIAVTTSRMNNNDKLYSNSNLDEYIKIADILKYVSIKPYLPENSNFILKQGEEKILKRGVGLNSIFDLRLYTDGLAVFGDKPNGVFQTEANFKQILNRGNIKGTGIIPFHNVKFKLNASKFDSEFAVVDSVSFNRSDLYQRSWLNSSVSLNVLNWWLGNKSPSSFYTDIGTGLNVAKLAKVMDTTSVISYSFFIEAGLDLNVSDNIHANFSSQFILNHSPQTDFNNQNKKIVFINPQIDISWHPLGNTASRIFGRISYVADTSDKKNHFMQLQFGYSILLSELVGKK